MCVKNKWNSNLLYQTNSATSGHSYFDTNSIFLPTMQAKRKFWYEKKPVWAFSLPNEPSSPHLFNFARLFCVVCPISHGTPWEGGPAGMRCLAWPSGGLQVLGKAGQWERLLGTSLTSYCWPKPQAWSPSSSAPGHQKEMYLIFKSLLEPKRIPAK